MLKMDFYFITFDGDRTGLCRSWSCPPASPAFSGSSVALSTPLKSSSQNYLPGITCFLTGYFCRRYLCTSSFLLRAWSVARVAADVWQVASRPPPAQLGQGAREFHVKPRTLPRVLAGAVLLGCNLTAGLRTEILCLGGHSSHPGAVSTSRCGNSPMRAVTLSHGCTFPNPS